MGYGYAKQVDEHSARAVLLAAPISTKQSIEVCAHLRGKSLQRAMIILEEVMQKKYAIPFRRFNGDVGHKTAIGPGRYPVKVAQYLLQLLKSVKANAVNKGLNEHQLVIVHLLANKASTPLHYGRKRSRKMKRTHIEVMVREVEKSTSKKEGTKINKTREEKKVTVKRERKQEEKKQEKVQKTDQKSVTSTTSEVSTAKTQKKEEKKEKSETQLSSQSHSTISSSNQPEETKEKQNAAASTPQKNNKSKNKSEKTKKTE